MIESLLDELPQRGIDEEPRAPVADATDAQSSEHWFLAALPVVQRIVTRRRSWLDQTNGSDLVQEVALRLWRWRRTNQARSEKLSKEEWNAFAARTAYNEMNRHFSKEKYAANVPLDVLPDIEDPSVEGQTEIEVFSLINQVWQKICGLSLRQRWALLLHSQELIIYLLQGGITEKEVAEVLELSGRDWHDIRNRLPLTDTQIAKEIRYAGRRRVSLSTAGSIKKARYEARVKLEGSIKR